VGSQPQPVDESPLLSSAEQQAEIARILGSETFRRSAKVREFLRYIADRTFCADRDSLSEQQIGIAVFGKDPGYNPGDDSVVRVQARHLREKLAEYFAREGCGDPVLVTVPKGRYVPVFAIHQPAGNSPVPEAVKPAPVRRWWGMALAGLLAFVAGLGLRPVLFGPLPSPSEEAAIHPLLAAVLQPDAETLVVLEDMGLLTSGSFRTKGETVGLNDYRQQRYLPEIPSLFRDDGVGRRVAGNLAAARFVAYANATFIFKLARAYPRSARNASARFPQDIHVRDVQRNNLILLGGVTDNPWVGLYEERLNFAMRYFQPGNGFTNRVPKGSEPATFGVGSFPHNPPYFARVALLPNVQPGRRVLILTGMGTAATESAAEFVVSPGLANRLPAEVVAALRRPESQVEVLLKCEPVLDAPHRIDVAAWRVQTK
jgi:hypothetical protein